MKKLVALLLTILLIFTFVGCRQAENLYAPTTPIAGDESSVNADELESESEFEADNEEEADNNDEDEADNENEADNESETEEEFESANGDENGGESATCLFVGHEDDFFEYTDYNYTEEDFYASDPWGYHYELVDWLEEEFWEVFDDLHDRLDDRIESLGENESQIEALEDRFDLFEEEIFDLLDILFDQRDEETITVYEFETRMRELIDRVRNFQI